MKVLDLLGKLGEWGPVLFGIGFIAPLVAQSMDAVGIDAPFGLATIQLGLLVGATTGLVAKIRGSWL
jgi:hypothetical protein